MKRPRLNGRSYDLGDREYRKIVIEPILEELADAQRRTDPARGSASEQEKDVVANLALRNAGRLVEIVAGWALDHVYGLSLAGEKLLAIPPQEIAILRDGKIDPADKHGHEFEGEQRRYPVAERPEEIDVAGARNLLRNLLVLNAGAFPLWLKLESVKALDALSFGETVPFLKRDPRGLRVKYRLLEAQLDALTIIEFRYASGMKKGVATEEVCNRLGETTANQNNWKRLLNKRLGPVPVERALSVARQAAALLKSLDAHASSNDDSNRDSAKTLCTSISSPYSDDALARLAKKYRALKRSQRAAV